MIRVLKIEKGLLFLACCWYISCQNESHTTAFRIIPEDHSGIQFSNTITETDSIHYFNFPYIYTGAGVAVGDINNDGLQDIFFAGNQVSNRLYLNRGNLQFEDITAAAGLTSQGWHTGVTMVDINQDGWQDIYVCVSGYVAPHLRKNKLFINQGDLQFVESADLYGLADDGHSTHAAFLDFDRDGDLDCYIMNHANESYAAISKLSVLTDGSGPSTDRLYEHVNQVGSEDPMYENVSAAAGINVEGYGLGLGISDLDLNGWPDIYIANDFIGSDLLYLNQGDGTFLNKIEDICHHNSQNGMGINISDLNNDAFPDILVMDMLPHTNERQKTMTSKMNYDYFHRTIDQGFIPQFIRNTLQLHQGIGEENLPVFSEVGRLAGLHQTDWSWAPLVFDADHDGLLDIYITNGFRRDVTNHDFQEYSKQGDVFEDRTGKLSIEGVLDRLFQLDSVSLPNHFFRNQGNLQFEDVTHSNGMGQPSISQGAAIGDLDNDGDIDLVVNNMNQKAFLYENLANNTSDFHVIRLNFSGPPGNRDGIGATVICTWKDGTKRRFENYATHGYMSCSEKGIHIGIGSRLSIDTILVKWPDSHQQRFLNLSADSTYLVTYDKNQPALDPTLLQTDLFQSVSERMGDFVHVENQHSDFRLEPLLLRQYDYGGPGIASGDMDQDGLQDLYFGGARHQHGRILRQHAEGGFWEDTLPGSDYFEDMGALFFDADGDRDLDLYVVSGGSSVKYFNKGHYQDRLYVNDGSGNLRRDTSALPPMASSGSCVVGADYDQDGDIDLFVGGYVVPGKFPEKPRSFLLRNDGGKFSDRTHELAPELQRLGMINAALWTDFDNDHDFDLLVAGEWMPITLFENVDHRFQEIETGLENHHGLWSSVVGGDFDADGDTDYLVGNLGSNSAYQASEDEPLQIYVHDFDQNTYRDAIITRFISGEEHSIAPRGALIDQIPAIQRAFPSYHEFAEADIHQIISAFDTSGMQKLHANYLLSSYIENQGNGQLELHPLPMEAQITPIYGMTVDDFDQDGSLDVLCIGNFRYTEVISGWYDAGHGLFLRGLGGHRFRGHSANRWGLMTAGDGRAMVQIVVQSDPVLVIARNNDAMQFYSMIGAPKEYIDLQADEAWGIIERRDGTQEKKEFYLGNGYLSQELRFLAKDKTTARVTLYNWQGQTRVIEM